jgi:HEAT repeat protein
MYREIIEHPWSLPDNIKKLLDLNSGDARGRIYRIAPDGFKPSPAPRLGRASTAELVGTLENRNGWHRDTAARLLYERQDPAAVPLLEKLLSSSGFALARLHALYALQGLAALSTEQVLKALDDADAAVRQHAIKLSEPFLHQRPPSSSQLVAKLAGMVGDPSIQVRYQLAFTLGEVDGQEKIGALAGLARRDVESSWTRAAIVSSEDWGAGES